MAYMNPVGGLNPRPTLSNLGRTDQGVDVSGKGPVYAMGAGTVEQIYSNTPGGWPGGGFILIKLDHPIGGHQYYYTAEDITPHVSPRQHVKTGQLIGTATGGPQGLELGWAAPAGSAYQGASLAAATTGYQEGQVTPAGQNFKSVLTALMSRKQPPGGTSATSSPAAGNTNLTAATQQGSGTGAAAAAGTGGCMITLMALPVVLPAALILRLVSLPSFRRAARGRGRRARGWRRRRTSGTAPPPPPP